uniref:Large ribosomal subunit protein eL22 n=1 Tax=Ixodes ricinus TaxID=34613 RepID=V5HRA7_IXORI
MAVAPPKVKRAVKAGQKSKGKKKKVQTKFTIDCTHPVEDGIMKVDRNLSTYLEGEELNVNGNDPTNLSWESVWWTRTRTKVYVTGRRSPSPKTVLERTLTKNVYVKTKNPTVGPGYSASGRGSSGPTNPKGPSL